MDLTYDAYDKEKELDGIWRKLEDDDSEFLVARHNNNNYISELTRLRDKAREVAGSDELSMEVAQEVVAKAVATTILLDWKNVTDAGKQVKYTPEVGAETFKNPQLVDLLNQIVLWAKESEQYKVRQKEELGND